MESSEKIKARIDDFPTSLVMILSIALIFLVVINALFYSDTPEIVIESGSPQANFDAVTALAHAERLSRTSEWTIASVLTLGSALIGLNWYTSRRNYEDEQQRIKDAESEFRARIKDIESSVLNRSQQALSEYKVRLDAFAEQLESQAQSTQEQLENLAWVIATELRATYMYGTPFPLSYWREDVRNLMFLFQLTRGFSALPSTTKVKEELDGAINLFLNRFNERWGYDLERRVSQFELFIIDSVGDDVQRMASMEVVQSWNRFASQFSVSDDDLTTPQPSTD